MRSKSLPVFRRDFNGYCNNEVQKVQYMNNHNSEGAAGYAELFGCKIVKMPYSAANMFMIIYMTRDPGEDPATLMEKMNYTMLKQINDATKNQQGCVVNITIPRIQMNYKLNKLIEIFEEGRIEALFKEANLCKGVNQSQVKDKLAVTTLKHAAAIKMNQFGTEAAAATVAGVTATAIRFCQNPNQFFVNREFGFFLMYSDIPMFSGLCYKPNYPISRD